MISLALCLTFATWAFGAAVGQAPCTPARRLAGVKQLVRTIETHRFEDAAKIPLDPRVTRVVTVYPTELGGNVPVPVPAGIDAASVRLVLVGGGQALFSGVEDPSYIINQNGSVTFDLIQTDFTALPYTKFREIHEYDLNTCLMTKIVGYGFGDLLPVSILS
ncbi:unnamed protein product [Cercospora beticola]|nr:unnamed protein product [Cercospora beticola]